MSIDLLPPNQLKNNWFTSDLRNRGMNELIYVNMSTYHLVQYFPENIQAENKSGGIMSALCILNAPILHPT